jgi:hypothetical protein
VASASVDLVYTGKGALIWLPDLTGWARDVARLLRPWGHLFVYEAHPAVTLWMWDKDPPRIREDRSYFGRSHVNDTFPARGAVEWQWTLGQIVTAVAAAGMEILHLGEYQEPFWRAGGVAAAAWDGRLPNSFACSPAGRGERWPRFRRPLKHSSGLKNAVLPRARHQGQTRSPWPRNCPMVRVQHGDRERWPWLPGTIVEQCGPDEWYVCIEVRELAMLGDGRRAPRDTPGACVLT